MKKNSTNSKEKLLREEKLQNFIHQLALQYGIMSEKTAQLIKTNNELVSIYIDQQALVDSIINSFDDAMLSRTFDGMITSWNLGAEKIFGYKAEEIIGQLIHILLPEQLAFEENEVAIKIMHGERPEHYETKRIKKGWFEYKRISF